MNPQTGAPVGWITAITFSGLAVAIFALTLLVIGIWIGLRTAVALIAVIAIITHRHAYGSLAPTKTAGAQPIRNLRGESDWRDG
ncbi:MAG: hypothetical protein WCT25_00405 [Candidatus Paceibacterota bacterium]